LPYWSNELLIFNREIVGDFCNQHKTERSASSVGHMIVTYFMYVVFGVFILCFIGSTGVSVRFNSVFGSFFVIAGLMLSGGL
jgi:hypothetical protein